VLVLLVVTGLVLLWGATLAERMVGRPTPWLGAVPFLLPHLYLAALLACVGLVALASRRRLAAVLALAHAGVGLVLWGPGWVTLGVGPQDDDLVVLSWNVKRVGQWDEDTAIDPARCLRQVVARAGPELLVLQEINRGQLEELVRTQDFACEFAAYRGEGQTVGGTAACAHSSLGALTLGRPLDMPEGWHYTFAEVATPSGSLNLLAVHLPALGPSDHELEEAVEGLRRLDPGGVGSIVGALAGGTERQVAAVRELLADLETLGDPTVVAGDFNSPPDTRIHRRLRRQLADVWTVAGRGPGFTRLISGWLPLRIDYVYLKDLSPVSAETLPDRCGSDHAPLLARIRRPRRPG